MTDPLETSARLQLAKLHAAAGSRRQSTAAHLSAFASYFDGAISSSRQLDSTPYCPLCGSMNAVTPWVGAGLGRIREPNPLTIEGMRSIHACDRFTFWKGTSPGPCRAYMHELKLLVDDGESG